MRGDTMGWGLVVPGAIGDVAQRTVIPQVCQSHIAHCHGPPSTGNGCGMSSMLR
jgi:hypothetical protein